MPTHSYNEHLEFLGEAHVQHPNAWQTGQDTNAEGQYNLLTWIQPDGTELPFRWQVQSRRYVLAGRLESIDYTYPNYMLHLADGSVKTFRMRDPYSRMVWLDTIQRSGVTLKATYFGDAGASDCALAPSQAQSLTS
jgi:hypothetical protein